MSNRVYHFEIGVNDVYRAIDFYTEVFGWTFKKWDGPIDYWLITTGDKESPGIDGGLTKRERQIDMTAEHPIVAYVCTVHVDDIDRMMADVTSAGGSIHGQKQGVPGVGWMCYCKDTEGNIFGLMQEDENA